ncbi:Metal tolerance protein C2 [Sarracenia purpurea var. burkii]
MENSRVSDAYDSRFPDLKSKSFQYQKLGAESPKSRNGEFGFGGGSDRRFAFSRQASFHQSAEPHTPISIIPGDSVKPLLSRTTSSIDVLPGVYSHSDENFWVLSFVSSALTIIRAGNRPMRRLLALIFFNMAYSTVELCVGLLTGRVGLVSDAFHLTFGCGLLTFSLFAMTVSHKKADRIYTYGQLFLLFMSFSLAVEALHAFIQDESEHKHYLIVSAVTNLLVNLIGVWFFRNYARISLVYRKAEDMNYHSVCLHVLADSIRSAGLILASWLLTLGVKNAEVLCLGLVSVSVFVLVMPLFKTTGGILLQMAPPSIPSSALSKCSRQVMSREEVSEISQARFWELVPGHVVGSLSLQVKEMDDRPLLEYVHDLYHDLGVQELTVQTDYAS